MTSTTDTTVNKAVVVNVPIDEAFRGFTDRFGDFKPAEHNLLSSPITETVFEGRVGGHIYDRAEDGSECHWARILIFEPPTRVVFSWDIGPTWQLETNHDNTSEVEVRFTPEGRGVTRIDLEHRGFDRQGAGGEAMRIAVESPNGWGGILQLFAAEAEKTN